ncbi:glutathione hydrolase-like YwrD proenzyme [Clavelina lepadiformis]|uniref:Gamma-glutamyltransferase n=1 Tax=Clavelina lepadiformis TaxID=159417 RepID=A0ABP0F6A6_CLALP
MFSSLNFVSRRSTLTCLNGCVASSQTIASEIGVDILRKGGNAADAAVAVAAALSVVEPYSTGLGGDMFCLYYDGKSSTIQGINGSGASPKKMTIDHLQELGFSEFNKMSERSVHCVTVPGACAGWVDCHANFGSGILDLKDLLTPAISLAKDGFAVPGPITAKEWEEMVAHLIGNKYGEELLVKDSTSGELRAPEMGEVFKNPGLANVLQSIADKGKDGFYKGWVAKSIVDIIKHHGGILDHEDLEEHFTDFVEPISVEYKGLRLWEIPPNSQGIVALEVLNILKNFNLEEMAHNSADYLHLLIEAVRLSFADSLQHCADMNHCHVPIEKLLNDDYGKMQAQAINKTKSMVIPVLDDPPDGRGDTVYFTTADKEGNFCSFINSTYMKFGTGIVPEGCGFALQNRGWNFSLKPGHPNVVAPKKRPYHTIIPAMVTDAKTGKLVLSFGVMGGFMQPQGHVQVLLNMKLFGMDPQQALDAPRFLVGSGHGGAQGAVSLEEGIPECVCSSLISRGHNIVGPVRGYNRARFGRGQVIAKTKIWSTDETTDVLWAGSDPRSDGSAVGY